MSTPTDAPPHVQDAFFKLFFNAPSAQTADSKAQTAVLHKLDQDFLDQYFKRAYLIEVPSKEEREIILKHLKSLSPVKSEASPLLLSKIHEGVSQKNLFINEKAYLAAFLEKCFFDSAFRACPTTAATGKGSSHPDSKKEEHKELASH